MKLLFFYGLNAEDLNDKQNEFSHMMLRLLAFDFFIFSLIFGPFFLLFF